ncbi:MAG: hypothetical protein MSB96_07925, partial [Subdoligranulum sp.]|nr:hypothetical protein [Subdoligranulum sp.]
MPDLLPAVSAVQCSGFIQRWVNACYCRQEYDHVIAHIFPDVGENNNDGEPGVAAQEHDGINADAAQQFVDHAVILEQVAQHAAHNSPGK